MHLEEASTKNKLQDILKILIQFWASAHVFISAKRHLSILNRELKKKKSQQLQSTIGISQISLSKPKMGRGKKPVEINRQVSKLGLKCACGNTKLCIASLKLLCYRRVWQWSMPSDWIHLVLRITRNNNSIALFLASKECGIGLSMFCLPFPYIWAYFFLDTCILLALTYFNTCTMAWTLL